MTIVSIALAASTLVTPPAPGGAADGKLKRDIPAGSVEGVWQYGRAEGDSERSGVDAGIFKGYKTTRSPSHR